MNALVQEIRIAVRTLCRNGGFAAVAVLTLGLGSGATVAIFTVVNGVLLRPLPYAQPERLVRIWNSWDETPRAELSPAEYFDLREQARVFSAMGVYATSGMDLSGDAEPQRVSGAWASAGLFTTLGVQPALGRLFTDADDAVGAAPVVLLSHELWQRRYGVNPSIVGRAVTVEGTRAEVIGVMPPDFRLPGDFATDDATEVFVPLGIDRTSVPNRGSHFLVGIGRLASGHSAAEATAELRTIAAGFVREFPDDYPAEMAFSTAAEPLAESITGPVRPALILLLMAGGLLLLIACANVANLLLIRAEDRQRELALRRALGAGRGQLVRQLLVESALLATAGGVLGLLISAGAVSGLLALRPPDLPRFGEVSIDMQVYGFALLLGFVTATLLALAPAVFATRLNAHAALKDGGGRATASGNRQTFRNGLVIVQMATALVLLLSAGLLVRSFVQLLRVDPGFTTDNVLTVNVALPSDEYASIEEVAAFYDQLTQRVGSLPNVAEAGAVTGLPLATTRGDLNFRVEGRPVPEGDVSPRADWQVVTPGYFAAMGMQVQRGRGVTAADRTDAPGVVVVNETTARRYWPRQDPIGQRIELGGGAAPEWPTVVGVVRDVRHEGLGAEPKAEMYLSHAQFRLWGSGSPMRSLTLTVRTRTDAAAMSGAVRREIRALNSALPLTEFTTMRQVRAASVARPRFLVTLLAAFATVALCLAAVSIYGLISYAVSRRTQEIGIRMALGARGREVVRMVVRQGALLVGGGIVLGVIGGIIGTRLLQGLLYQVHPVDPVIFSVAPLLLAIIALLASYVPARRATRIDPMIALRAE
jgi:putative ABC transport system permease protein